MSESRQYNWRIIVVGSLLIAALAGLFWRLIDLNILNRAFLLRQSKARILRVAKIPAYRGMIKDRFGEPLAISTPVSSIWLNPQLFNPTFDQLKKLSVLLHISPQYIRRRGHKIRGREFVYLKRGIAPILAKQVLALDISGVFAQKEYKRFYPEGEVAAHVVGLTDIDDQGQEGLELAYNKWLSGVPGKKEVVKDRLGHVVANLALLRKPKQGRDLTLSIDHRLQYLAYRYLQQAVQRYHATAGSVVIMSVPTGEVLAMVNQPSYNPNERPRDAGGRYRNRAATDLFEPGSTMKPFTIAYAIASKKYRPSTIINTNPGWMRVGGHRIRDDLNYGVVNLTQVLQKSSNIGAAKILLSLPARNFWHLLGDFGFGKRTRSGFPGESSGNLNSHASWLPSVVATLAYGYGISVTTLQLAHAYAVLANHGVKVSVSLTKIDQPQPGVKVLDESVADQVVQMLKSVVEKGGTGTRAAVKDYQVAGKTGTAYIAGPNGYDKHRYIASFVGIAPASDPKLVVAVMIRDPKGKHFGGLVAAPVFAKVMAGSLRLMNIPPDAIVK